MLTDIAPVDIVRTPYAVAIPTRQTMAVVFASPHSGSHYPAEFVSASRLDPVTLRRSEDAFVDELFADVSELGAPLIKALFPRAYVDVNREPYELDPAMFVDSLPDYVNIRSPRVAGGLGTIARVVANGAEIYRAKLSFAEAKARIESLWQPYHETLAQLIGETKRRFGHSLVIDCHSMPSIGGPMDRDPGRRRVDFVLGDCHGASCAPEITDEAERCLKELGYVVARNDPYAGGFTTRHYGRPNAHEHAMQVEVNRALYMDEARITRKPYLVTLSRQLRLLAERIDTAAGTACRRSRA